MKRATLRLLATLIVIAAPSGAAVAPPTQGSVQRAKIACPRDQPNCLAWLEADLDEDGKPDRIFVSYDDFEKKYFVAIETSQGQTYHPFMAAHDSKRDRVTLTYRKGWDYRCRNYVPGKQCGHGYSDHYPGGALYLSDSRHGDYVLMLMIPYTRPNRKPTDSWYMIMPALEDPR